MPSEAPPSCADLTTSFTWADLVEVKTLTSSGMIAPARVPHEMMADSFHHSVPSPRSGIITLETIKVKMMETIDVIQTSEVNGVSKSMSSEFAYFALAIAPFRK